MKLVNGIWQKYANPVRSRFILFKNRRELRRVKKSFFKNNFLSDNLSDKFVKSFPRTLGNFIGGNELLQNEHGSEIKKFLLERIEKDFVYYSEKYIREFLKEQYDEISLYLESEGDSWSNCYVSSILNKDTSTNNSSRELLSTFREVNELPRNATITLEKYFQHENDYYEIREGYRDKISKNPYNIYLKKKLNNEEKKYKSKKFELSSKLHDEMKSKKYFIFIDDFSGSGATIKNFFEIMNDYFDSDIKIIIICIHMMQTAENKLRKYFDDSKYKNRVKIYIDKSKENSRKKFFSKKDPLKKKIREFETVNFHQQFALGFEATEALVSTYDNCPNNTFSSFWFSENQKWTPLFHRPRKRSEAYKEMREKNSNFVNDIKYALSEKKVTPRDMKLVIILLVVKTGKDDTTNRVEIDLKDNFFYNKNDIQECLKNQYVMIKSSSSTKSTYILTQKGKNKLKEYKLSAASFKKLINKKTGFLDKLELTDNYESELLENKSAE